MRTKRQSIWGKRFVWCIGSCLLLASCAQGTQAPSHQSSVSSHALSVAQPEPRQLSADEIVRVDQIDQYTDPAYGTTVRRVTSAADGQGRMRHEYSRRQAFSADSRTLLAQDGAGYWFLYDATTGALIKPLPELAGDSEPLWHPREANVLYFTERGGGLIWWRLNVETGEKTVAYDFSTNSPWPEAASYWTKGEGTTSADGRYLTLLATRYDEATQQVMVYGIVMLDLDTQQIIGQLDASAFPVPNALPDHVSTAPSGQFAVVSWLQGQGGTVAYSPDFKTAIPLAEGSEHSDLAIDKDGRDVLVYADYSRGTIRAIDVATAQSTDLHTLYPAPGEGYALHISGQSFLTPGWVVVSTYGDFADYGNTVPAPTLQPEYRKVWLMELAPGGKRYNVAHIRNEPVEDEMTAYFLEPQASANRELSQIVFASNLSGKIESYVIDIPESWVK